MPFRAWVTRWKSLQNFIPLYISISTTVLSSRTIHLSAPHQSPYLSSLYLVKGFPIYIYIFFQICRQFIFDIFAVIIFNLSQNGQHIMLNNKWHRKMSSKRGDSADKYIHSLKNLSANWKAYHPVSQAESHVSSILSVGGTTKQLFCKRTYDMYFATIP